MKVQKRDGNFQPVDLNKILIRLQRLSADLSHVDCPSLVERISKGLIDGIPTSKIDEYAAETCCNLMTVHYNYGVLALRVGVSNLHNETKPSFRQVIEDLYRYPKGSLIADDVYDIIMRNAEEIEKQIDHTKDLGYSYFGFKTLCGTYLLRINGKIHERIQHMLMRVSIGIHKNDLDSAFKTYQNMSDRIFTHATPTMFNAGTRNPQCSSCFLLAMKDDSIQGIYETLAQCALISKSAGGIGINVSNIRASGSYIAGTNGISNGLVPMLRVFNATARYVDQCFAEGTLVMTETGWLPIEDLKIGQRVLTHTGKFHPIKKTLKYPFARPPVYSVNGVIVTGQHEVLIGEDKFCAENERYRQWRAVKDLLEGDFGTFPLPQGTGKTVSQNSAEPVELAEIREIPYFGPVYDLEVSIDHTYVTQIGIVHNGGGRRKGAFAIYIEPWHADIFEVLELKKNTGPDELRARDLFYGLWIPDLFMKRVKEDSYWSLMCPAECPGLVDCYGKKFEALYEHYEENGKFRKRIRARDLWFAILEIQCESGVPYMLFKDSVNEKNNQKNLGCIRGSNLCTEIVEFTSADEVAVCNLASVSLTACVESGAGGPAFNHHLLYDAIYQMTVNLNKIIDNNQYPVPEARNSNLKHRPIGLGVQGLQNVFFLLRFPFDSPEARRLNRDIFETIYFAALTASNHLAIKDGVYESFAGSPASEGILQFDMWVPEVGRPEAARWPWHSIKESIIKHGLRNSLLIAPMPTASTSQILGNIECFEPLTANVFTKSTLTGNFQLVNEYLINDLTKLGLWNEKLKDKIISAEGSIQNIPEIPPELKKLYKTVWEISQKVIIDMAADRGRFIDQSQSLNIHFAEPTLSKLNNLHFYAWESGLKTGMYYLRSRPPAEAIKFTVTNQAQEPDLSTDGPVCTREAGCVSCGS